MTNQRARAEIENFMQQYVLTLEEQEAMQTALRAMETIESALATMNDRLEHDFYFEICEDDVLRDCIELLTPEQE